MPNARHLYTTKDPATGMTRMKLWNHETYDFVWLDVPHDVYEEIKKNTKQMKNRRNRVRKPSWF